jgi:hypothetical protein
VGSARCQCPAGAKRKSGCAFTHPTLAQCILRPTPTAQLGCVDFKNLVIIKETHFGTPVIIEQFDDFGASYNTIEFALKDFVHQKSDHSTSP